MTYQHKPYSVFNEDNYFPGEHDQRLTAPEVAIGVIAVLITACAILTSIMFAVEGGLI